MEFSQLSDAIMLPILEAMPPFERKKLLLLNRMIVHPQAHAWIDQQLAKLTNVEIDPDWLARLKSDPKIAALPSKLARWAQQTKNQP